jgi:CO/xanthine dehydrogenase Mo-binding subunit
MKFDTPATTNPIDRLKVVGQAVDRIDGPLKTTGKATYAYEQNAAAPDAVYGYIVGAAIAKGRIASIDVTVARQAPGVLGVVTALNAGTLGKGEWYTARALAGPEVEHYHQAVAIVVATTFEQARSAAQLVRVRYVRAKGAFDLEAAKDGATTPQGFAHVPPDGNTGDFEGAFATAPVQLDATYTTPDQSHAMMEPYATIAAWDGPRVTLWTSIQQVSWGVRDLAKTLGIPKENIRVVSPYIGGGFGGKSTTVSDAVLAALAARQVRRPVKVALQRALVFNNTSHRPATIQRIRIGSGRDGRITAIGHESWSGNLPGGRPEAATIPVRLLYAGPNRMTRLRLAHLDLPEGSAMRAPGEAPGMMALEIAMDEMAEKLGLRSRRLPRDERHPGRPRKSPTPILDAAIRGMPAHRRRAFRLECAQCASGRAPRWPLAGRHGNGIGDSRCTDYQVGRAGLSRQPRDRHRRDGHDGYRHRHLYHHCADRRRDDGCRYRQGGGAAGRLALPRVSRFRRAAGRGVIDCRRLRGVRQVARGSGAVARHRSSQCAVFGRPGARRTA